MGQVGIEFRGLHNITPAAANSFPVRLVISRINHPLTVVIKLCVGPPIITMIMPIPRSKARVLRIPVTLPFIASYKKVKAVRVKPIRSIGVSRNSERGGGLLGETPAGL